MKKISDKQMIEIHKKLEEIDKEDQLLKKMLDKGGVVVVATEKDEVITVYNYQGHSR